MMTNDTFNWSDYKGNLKWLPERTIYLTKHGSHAYGTNTPTSDLDLRGIAIAPKEYYLGFHNRFEQAESKGDPDLVIFDIKKFFHLAADCNPNALELIFTDSSDHLHVSPVMQKLLDNRHKFLSQRVKHTFQGYAHAQMKRILTHRKWLLEQEKYEQPPKREDFGLLPEREVPKSQLEAALAAVKKVTDSWEWRELEELSPSQRLAIQDEFQRRLTALATGFVTKSTVESPEVNGFIPAAQLLGFDSNFIEYLDKERRYLAALREHKQYLEWKKNRNPDRAAMEAKFGYDGKHAMHLVRLSRCCLELLTTGELHVKRDDAKELLSIRDGVWKFDNLKAWFQEQDKIIEEAAKASSLPKRPDIHFLDQLCMEVIEEML